MASYIMTHLPRDTVVGPQRCNMEGCAATWKTWTRYAVFYGMEYKDVSTTWQNA